MTDRTEDSFYRLAYDLIAAACPEDGDVQVHAQARACLEVTSTKLGRSVETPPIISTTPLLDVDAPAPASAGHIPTPRIADAPGADAMTRAADLPRPSTYLFVCYSHRGDREYVEALTEYLTSAGLSVWFDREIATGDRWESVIRAQIDSCAALIVVMSPEAEDSDWVSREIHRAETKGKPIVPLLLRGEPFFRLSNIHFADVTSGAMPSEAFVAQLQRLTVTSPTPPAPEAADDAMGEVVRKIDQATQMLLELVGKSGRGVAGDISRPREPAGLGRRLPPLIADFAAAEIGRLSTYLKFLVQVDELVYDGEDRDWLLTLTEVAKHSIDATSLVTVDGGPGTVGGGFWRSAVGAQYLEAQQKARPRGVRIRRIFIIDDPELRADPELIDILRLHAAVGVEVRTLSPADIPVAQHPPLQDLIIFDGVLSYHATPSNSVARGVPPAILATTLITDSTNVAQRLAQYEELWRSAHPFEP